MRCRSVGAVISLMLIRAAVQMGMTDRLTEIQVVSEVASKEYQLERALTTMADEWKVLVFEHIAYRCDTLLISMQNHPIAYGVAEKPARLC
jgi:hypothetical protein